MTPQKPQTVGFIGIGSMGRPMSRCLAQAGFTVTLNDVDQAGGKAHAQSIGAKWASTPAEAAKEADVVITMLPNSQIVEHVLSQEDGVLSTLRAGAVVIDMSSSIPAHTQRLAQVVEQAGGVLVDAPVSGGVSRAETGSLAIMAGGPAEAIDRVEPVLQAMGSSVLRTGTVGSAHAMKALNNLVSAGGFLIGIEALMIGQRFGLDPDMMVDVLNASTGMNNSTQKKFKQYVLSRQFNSGFGLDLMVKDLTIATGLATDSQTPAPFAMLCRELWAASAGLLGPGEDHTAVAKLVERLAQTELRPD